MHATRLAARLSLAVVFVAGVDCSKDTPSGPTVDLVGTLKITGMASEFIVAGYQKIWQDVGTADLSVKASAEELRETGGMVTGSGKGVAGFTFARPGCEETAKFDATYTISGQLSSGSTCMLALHVDVKWTNGVGTINCGGYSLSQPQADYSYSVPAVFENNAHEIHETVTDGGLEWDYRFELQRFDSTGVTRCQFNR